jgi:hypothetical protein
MNMLGNLHDDLASLLEHLIAHIPHRQNLDVNDQDLVMIHVVML